MIKNMTPSKEMRVGILYSRLMMMLAVVSTLGSKSGVNFGMRRNLDEVSLNLDVYILLIPFFTFVPMEILLRSLLSADYKKPE